MARLILFTVLTLVALTGSDCLLSLNPGGTVCTALYAYGVSASVTNANTGAAIPNATLTLKDGDYSEVMQAFPGGNDYVGAGERAGTYTLTAEAPGFESKTIENIVVTADECHVKGVHVDVQLQPMP